MKVLDFKDLQEINGGESFLDGVCAGLSIGGGILGALSFASSYGWVAAIPGVGQAAAVVGIGALVTCGIAAVAD